jgi:RNA polymerase sigma-70 factor (ECF subfamily)
MESDSQDIKRWVGTYILPHESYVRAWLLRARLGFEDVDDVLQESYCRLSGLTSVAHIQDPRSYFFQVARHVALEQVRRASVVRIDCVEEIEKLGFASDLPSPERVLAGREELRRIRALIDTLPARCRQVFELRKIQGLSQREVSRIMDVPEHTVENESAKGLKIILSAMAGDVPAGVKTKESRDEARRQRN